MVDKGHNLERIWSISYIYIYIYESNAIYFRETTLSTQHLIIRIPHPAVVFFYFGLRSVGLLCSWSRGLMVMVNVGYTKTQKYVK